MRTLAQPKSGEERVTHDRVTTEELKVILENRRMIIVPLEWLPRLCNSNEKEKNTWRFISGGIGIHWELIDEDISAEGLLRNS